MLFLCLLILSSGEMFKSFEVYLNPGDIFYPTLSWQATPTYLTSNHAGDTINMTIYFYTQVKLLKGYYVALTIGFDLQFTTTLESDQAEDEDNYLTFYNIVFPTAKAYGPFRLIIYSSAKGQIVASCVSYGGVSIAPKRPDPATLTIKFTDDSSRQVKKSSALSFFFKIQEKTSLDDYAEININDGFSIINNPTIIFEYNDLTLQSYSHSVKDGIIGFYDFQTTFEKGGSITITINGFINPYMDALKVYTWNIAFYRFGTRTIKQWFNGTGPGESLSYPNVRLISWLPTNEYTEVALNTALYMDFIIEYNITLRPLLGHIATFYGVNLTAKNYVSLYPNQSDFTLKNPEGYCSILPTANYFGCKSEVNQIIGVTLFLFNPVQVTFRGLFEINSEKATFLQHNILESQDDASLTMGSVSAALETKPNFLSKSNNFLNFRVFFVSSDFDESDCTEDSLNVVNQVGTDDISLVIKFETVTKIGQSEEIFVYLPYTTEQNNVIELLEKIYLNGTFTSSVCKNESTSTIQATIKNETNYLIISFDTALDVGTEIELRITPEKLRLPYISSDIYSKYESMISYTYKPSLTDETFIQSINQIYFVPNVMEFSFNLMCNAEKLQGLVALVQIKFPFDFSFSGTKFIDIGIVSTDPLFLNDLGSGIKSGLHYPSYGLDGDVTLIYGTSSSLSTLRIESDSLFSGEIKFYIPFIQLSLNNVTSISANAKIQFPSMRLSTIFSSDVVTIIQTESIDKIEIDLTSVKVNEEITESFGDLDLSSVSSNPILISVSLPSNFQSDYLNLDSTKIYFSSFNTNADPNYQYLFSFTDLTKSSSSVSFKFGNLKAPWYSGNFLISIFVSESSQSESFTADVSCALVKKYNIKIEPDKIELKNNSCHASGYGPSSQLINLTFEFNLLTNITVYPGLSDIYFEINENLQLDSGNFILKYGNFTYSSTISYLNTILIPNWFSVLDHTEFTLIFLNLTSPPGTDDDIVILDQFAVRYNEYIVAEINNVECYISENTDTGVSNIEKLMIFPNQRDVQELASVVYFQVIANFTLDIPALSNITLVGQIFDSDENAKANTWSSHIVQGVAFTKEGYLSIINLLNIPKGESFQLRKDIAFSIPNNKSIQGTEPITFLIKYKDTIIIKDSSDSSDRIIKYLNRSSVQFTSIDISASKYNQGELEYYTFKFKLTNDTSSNWAYVIDVPGSYDAHFGNATINFPEKEPEVYYLKAKSELANIKCSVDHWVVVCTGFEVIQSGMTIDISIQAYTPPRAKSEDFFIYIVDKNDFDQVHAVGTSNLLSPFTSVPGDNLDLISVVIKDPDSYDSDYIFTVSFNSKYFTGSVVMFSFPIQYLLDRDNPKKINCSALYESKTFNSTNDTCTVDDKFITFKFKEDIELYGTVYFTFKSIMNPFHAWHRETSSIPNFIKTNYSLWTQKFELYSILKDASQATGYDYKSYMNRNAAYAGYNKRIFEEILINDFNSQENGYSLEGCPGTISVPIKISVKDNKLLAQNLTLTPWEYNGKIKFDKASYVLTSEQPVTYFRMKVLTDLEAFGRFYISMNVTEVPLVTNKKVYGIPTRIPVYLSLDYAVSITIDTTQVFNVKADSKSLPIKVDLLNQSPASKIFIEIRSDNYDFIASPQLLEFKEGHYYKFFTITPSVDKSSYALSLILSDSDKSSFIRPTGLALPRSTSEATEEVISLFNYTQIDQTSLTLSIQLSSPSVIYWAFGGIRNFDSNPSAFSYSSCRKNSFDPANPDSSASNMIFKQIDKFIKYINKLISLNADYETYSIELTKYAEKLVFYGAEVIGTEKFEFGPYEMIVPGVEYFLILYAFNGNLNETIDIKTDPVHPAQDLKIIAGDKLDEKEIIRSLAQSAMFPSYRFKKVLQDSRRLATEQTFRVFSSPSYGFTSDKIVDDLIQGQNNKDIKINSNETYERNQSIPSFTHNKMTIYKDTGLRIEVAIDQAGQVCCIIEKYADESLTLYSYDIFLGYGRDRQVAFQYECRSLNATTDYNTTFKWEFKGNTQYGDYDITCCACNNYPVIPQCNDDYVEHSVTWIKPEVSFGSFVMVLIGFYLI